jgi:hypothetical protein
MRSCILTAITWLAAVTTLLAGTPHCRCVCPDGKRSLCLPLLSGRGLGCGCLAFCCACPSAEQSSSCTAPAEDEEEVCCPRCRKEQRPPAPSGIQQRSCTHELASAAVEAVTPSKDRPLTPPPPDAIPIPVASSPTVRILAADIRPTHPHPALIDRVITLRRLLI